MLKIGITGGSGCGTTTFGNILSEKGVYFINADEVYHNLLESDCELREGLVQRFGARIAENGRIDRRVLAGIVFSDAGALADLERITHRAVTDKIGELLRERAPECAAIEAIALFECGLAASCDATVGVICDRRIRLERIIARDGLTPEQAEARISAQKPDEYYIANCGYIADNSGTVERLRETAEKIYAQIRKGK